MKYGSLRFNSATSNNVNELVLRDVDVPKKVVVDKDVALILPKDPKQILPWESYPTHQESWLPLWFIAQYHAKAETNEELAYQRELAEQVPEEHKQLLREGLLKKAQDFMADYHASSEEPRKKFKTLTRLVQDILLYLDMPKEPITDHDEFLEQSPYAEFIRTANELRLGEGLERADELVAELERVVQEKLQEVGGEGAANEAFAELQNKFTQHGEIHAVGEKFKTKPPTRDMDFYLDMVASPYDLELAADEHDLDVVSVRDEVTEPEFHQIQRITEGRRMDAIVVPQNLKEWSGVKGGHESFQPVSYMVLTHTAPKTEAGQALLSRLETEISPRDVAEHYLGAAKDFFDGEGFGKSWAKRREADVPMIKKVIPLHRVARDLLPRAIYMLKNNQFPHGVSDEELFKDGETDEIATQIGQYFETQAGSASVEDLDKLAELVREKLMEYWKAEHSERYAENLEHMREMQRPLEGEQRLTRNMKK